MKGSRTRLQSVEFATGLASGILSSCHSAVLGHVEDDSDLLSIPTSLIRTSEMESAVMGRGSCVYGKSTFSNATELEIGGYILR